LTETMYGQDKGTLAGVFRRFFKIKPKTDWRTNSRGNKWVTGKQMRPLLPALISGGRGWSMVRRSPSEWLLWEQQYQRLHFRTAGSPYNIQKPFNLFFFFFTFAFRWQISMVVGNYNPRNERKGDFDAWILISE
jgi:hypothetical protein